MRRSPWALHVRVLLAGLGLLASLSGCARLSPASPHSVALRTSFPADTVRSAILVGLAGRDFLVQAEAPGSFEATAGDVNVFVRIAISFDVTGYSIRYLESVGYGESPGDDGVVQVDARYHRLIRALGRTIDDALDADAMGFETSGAELASPTGARPAVTGTALAEVRPRAIVQHEPEPARERHPLYEVLGPGVALFAGMWALNWITTLTMPYRETPATSPDRGEMIGLSFAPLVGPALQLGYLKWESYDRWGGLFFLSSCVLQVAGLVLTIVGAVIQVDGGPAAETLAGAGRTWMLAPVAYGTDGGGLELSMTF